MSLWVRPVNAPITQEWGQIPGADWGVRNPDGAGGHPGTDYGCAMGTPILAASAGRVSYAGYATGFGWNAVCIYHGADGVTTTSGHMESHYVWAGEDVYAGQPIGLADTQGQSTGSHLHFELRPGTATFGGNPPNIDSDLWLHNHGAYGASPLQPAGQLTAAQRNLIGQMQAILHVHVDKAWGKQTDDALQLIRYFSLGKQTHSATVIALQQLWGQVPDGFWGAKTDQAYLFWRWCFLNK
jgi:murein DD-endopeptidase MepM/ murein hydrolase activator NlpD